MSKVRSNDTEIVYARSATDRWLAGFTGPIMFGMCTALLAMIGPALPWAPGHSPLELTQPVGFLTLIELFGIGMLIFGLYSAGPEDLVLDLKTRTYRFRRGFPLLAGWKTGPFSDIGDIVLRKNSTKSGVSYKVALQFRDGGQGILPESLRRILWEVPLLYNAKSRDDAMREMDLVSEKLKLPGIPGHEEDGMQAYRRSLSFLLFGIALSVLFVGVMFGPSIILDSQFKTQGRTVKGIVTDSKRGSKINFLYFAYSVNGQTLHGRDEITLASFQQVNIGDVVDVTYLPNYPRTSRTSYTSDTGFAGVATLGLAGGSLLAVGLYSIYQLRRQYLG